MHSSLVMRDDDSSLVMRDVASSSVMRDDDLSSRPGVRRRSTKSLAPRHQVVFSRSGSVG